MNRIICFLLVLFSANVSNAQLVPEKLTKAQTVFLIDSITHSNKRCIKKEYSYEDDKLLLSTEIHINNPADTIDPEISYEKYYHENGRVAREGLSFGHDIGVWLYYDTTGKLFKEYDFTTHKRILYGMEKEPFDYVFDSVLHMTQRFAIRHYGKEFYNKYVIVDTNVRWSPIRYLPGGNSLPNTPYRPAKEYSVYTHVEFDDSVSGPAFSVNFDSTLHITWVSYLSDTATFFPKINVDYKHALKIAKAHGFDNVSLGDWDDEKKVYYWLGSYELSSEGDEMHQVTHGKSIRINSQTGKYSVQDYEGGFDADGFISDFQKEWKDTLKTPDNYKQISFSGATLDFPPEWLLTENYHYKTYEHSYYMSDGKDTVMMNEDCGLAFDDFYNYKKPAEDEIAEQAFLSNFKDKTVQGRMIKLEILLLPDNKYSIDYSLIESGVAFNCGPIVYEFKTNSLTGEEMDKILSILKTVRFRTY